MAPRLAVFLAVFASSFAGFFEGSPAVGAKFRFASLLYAVLHSPLSVSVVAKRLFALQSRQDVKPHPRNRLDQAVGTVFLKPGSARLTGAGLGAMTAGSAGAAITVALAERSEAIEGADSGARRDPASSKRLPSSTFRTAG